MKVVFFGSPEAALPSFRALLGSGHSVELVVTQPDKPAGRGRRLTACPVKRFAEDRRIPVLTPLRIRKDETVLPRIEDAGPDIQVVVAYGQIIPGHIIYHPRYKTLNVHFSVLPRHRGAAPVQWTILSGDTETGVTIMELNEKMDEGDVLATARVAVLPEETAGSLESRLAAIGADLLVRTIDKIDGIEKIPQDPAAATLAPKIRKEDCRIDWTESAAVIDRKVRAFYPRPGAFTFIQGGRIQVLRGRVRETTAEESRPGEIVSVGREGIAVAAGDSAAYLVEDVQPEGKSRMAAFAFSLGARLREGDILGGS